MATFDPVLLQFMTEHIDELLLVIASRVLRRRRRVRARQLLLERPLRSECRVLVAAEQTLDPDSFRGAYRMSQTTFDELLELVKPRLEVQDTLFRETISAEERLGLTIRYA